MSSFIRFPQWMDQGFPVHLSKTKNIAALIRIFSFKPEYVASWEKEPEGRINGSLQISYGSPDAWAVVPVFSGNYSDSGLHQVPLFKGGPVAGCLAILQDLGCTLEAVKMMLKKGQVTPLSCSRGNTTLTLKIMDGHFTDSTWWKENKDMEVSTMLEAIGGKQSCCLEVEKGKSWQDYVLSSLPPKVQKKGASHKKYKQVAAIDR